MSTTSEGWSNIKNLFALIIGINNYPHATKLKGAVADADRFESLLQEKLKVRKSRIINLRDGQATRKRIEDAFCSLWEIKSINYDDPIVIYFAGHGCKIPRPPGWDAGGRNEIEGIFPYDVQSDQQQETNNGVFPIPDLTIATWLNILSYKKGNNITVIFDCCHSASGVRGDELIRAGTFQRRLPDGIDKEYFKILRETVPPTFTNQHSLSHVFLAACGADESAVEANNKGRFTTALLDALNEPDVHARTYAEFMNSLRGIPGQSPQCEGHLKNRILFSNTLKLGYGIFTVTRKIDDANKTFFLIDAGSIHGIQKNSLFNMFESATVNFERNPPICQLRAVHVSPFSTEATLTERCADAKMIKSGFVRQKCSGKALNVHITSALQAVFMNVLRRTDVTLCVKKNEKHAGGIIIGGETAVGHPDVTLILMKSAKDADFIVHTDGAGNAVLTTNLSYVTTHGFTQLPKVIPAQPENIVKVLRAASQWTQHLDKDVSVHSKWIDNIEIEFCALHNSLDEAGYTHIKPEVIPSTAKNVVFITVPPDKDNRYGMILHNKTHLDFHVSIISFDIDHLEIQSYFSGPLGVEGKGNADPSLRKEGYLTIGYGNGGGRPLSFESPKGGINVTIFKLYFTSMPMDLGWLAQESPFPKDEEEGEERGVKSPRQVMQHLSSHGPRGATTTFTVVQRTCVLIHDE